ncbi:MAG: aminopeptidase P family protein [Firmicutes bacterium]|nr:aminopeptidase P family protein [Bacillota bacterium]
MSIIEELKGRHEKLSGVLDRRQLDAALIAGNSAVGPLFYGCFRYFTDWRVYYHLQAFIMRPHQEPVVCAGSILHLQGLTERGFKDIRFGAAIRDNALKALAERPPRRLGVCFDMLPADWYRALTKEFPGIELVDITNDIYELRAEHTPLELERIRKCALIADAGYEAVCRVARPGARMMDLHAELDYAMRKAGAEEVFTLMANGRFKYYVNGLPCIKSFGYPDNRVVQPGDSIGMEITPRYMGYWTQLVRTISVGEPDPDLIKAHKLQLETMENSRKKLYTGNTLGAMLKDMWVFGTERGFDPKLPFGHILGADLDEGGRGSLESDFVFRENTCVVLHPTLTLGDMDYSIFWGDNYLVTKDGGERINKCSTELQIL